MFKVILPIRVYTDEELILLEQAEDDEEIESIPMTGVDTIILYSIDSIKKNNYDSSETILCSGGITYFIPMKIKDVEKNIDKQINQFRYGFN